MSILLSVNPPFAGWLVDGDKTTEWRTKPLPKGTAYIYETKKNGGCGMVIGAVYFGTTNGVPKELLGSEKEGLDYLRQKRYSDSVIDRTMEVTAEFVRNGKVSKEYLAKYAKGKKAIYANEGWDYKRYAKPIPLSEFIHPSEGCCNEGKCRGCKWFDLGNEWAGLEDDCLADFDTDCFSPVRRPPQSWCYVEDLKGEIK